MKTRARRISRYSFLDPQSFYNCVEHVDERGLTELTTPYRMERPSPEQSHEFMSLHFPPGEALRHLIDHVSSIRRGIDFGPSAVLPRLVRLRTRLSVTYENDENGSSKSRENGKAYKKGLDKE